MTDNKKSLDATPTRTPVTAGQESNFPDSGLGLFLDSIVENLPNMVFVKDAEELRFVLFNRAGEELIGHPREEMIGKNDYDLFPREEADFFTRKDREVLAGGKLVDIPEEPIHTSIKGTRTLHTKKIPLLDENGTPRYLLGISEDITEKKETERRLRQSERLASVGTLAAGIAHEINNPIGAILLHAQTALRLDPDQNEERQHILGQIVEQSMRCGRIVRSVLRFGKHRSSEKWTTDINAAVQKATRFVSNEAEQRGATITHELSAESLQVGIEPVEAEQVVVNLLLNSIEAAEEGICTVVATEKTADGVRITVTDNGPGIPAEKRDYVFDPFYTGKQEGSTGLGLSIVRGIVESHRGIISAECPDSGGTRIVVDLPC